MSFFTDDDVKPEIVDIVDPKETFHKPIGFGETVSNSRTAHKHAESVLSPYYNEQEAITKRSDYVRTREGREVDEVLKDFGYSGAYAGSQRYGGDRDLDEKDRDEAFKKYRASLPENERENVLVGEALRLQGIELGRKLTLEAKEKLKKTKLGTFGNLFANFLGAGSVMMQNPLFVASQIVLPEVVFAKYLASGRGLTLGARVGARAGIEGVAGGAYEAVTQPFVAANKEEMKLKHTSGDVMRNILFGTVFGASFGGAFEIGAGGLRKLRTGEWGISEYNSHVAKHYDQMSPELRHAHELVDQATENGRMNPFGDTPEGVQRHIDETLKAEQFVNQEIRDVPQGDIEAAQNLAKEIEAQSNELPDVQKLRDEFLAEHQLTPAPKPEGDIPDGFAFLNDVANDLLPENVRVQVVDEIERAAAGLKQFAGEKAETANSITLREALTMRDAGASPDDIWSETGWFQGTDGKWRFEIDDSKAVFKLKDLTRREDGSHHTLEDILEHHQLFQAYPEARNIKLEFDRFSTHYDPEKQVINLSLGYAGKDTPEDQLLSNLLHELQHWVQHKEGFTNGSNATYSQAVNRAALFELDEQLRTIEEGGIGHNLKPLLEEMRTKLAGTEEALDNDFTALGLTKEQEEAYRRSAGEVEARNVQERLKLSSEERRAIAPFHTQDTPVEQIIDPEAPIHIERENAQLISDSINQAFDELKIGPHHIPEGATMHFSPIERLGTVDGNYIALNRQGLISTVQSYGVKIFRRELIRELEKDVLDASANKALRAGEIDRDEFFSNGRRREWSDEAFQAEIIMKRNVLSIIDKALDIGGEALEPMPEIRISKIDEEGLIEKYSGPSFDEAKFEELTEDLRAKVDSLIKKEFPDRHMEDWETHGWAGLIDGKGFFDKDVMNRVKELFLAEVKEYATLARLRQYEQVQQFKLKKMSIESVDSPEFRKWFGDSKVVDDEGKPLVVYHGTEGDFDAFSTGGGRLETRDTGSFFSSDPNTAYSYAGNKGKMYPVYLSIKKPLVVDARGGNWNFMAHDTTIDVTGSGVMEDIFDVLDINNYPGEITTNDLARIARERGFDGLWVKDVTDNGGKVSPFVPDGLRAKQGDIYVAFEPTQIKSINNRGTFDSNDPRILYQLGDNAPKAKSTSDSLTGTHIEAPDELYDWLGVEPAKFQADYTKIAKKREATQQNNPLSDPEAVRDHVEHTLGNAVFALRHREGNWNLISIDGVGRLTSVDLRLKKSQYRVVTAHTLSNGQLEDKIRGVFKEHGEDGFKWKVDPRRSQSGVPQEDPSFVIRMGINDQLSADDIIRYIREMQGFQGRAGHPSVFSNSLEDGIQGAFRSTDNLIQIARSAIDPTATLRHEAIHALKALDLFKAEEWSLLEETARQMDWIKKHDIEARYKAEFDGDEATRQRAMLEEAIAEEFSKWRRGELEVTQEIKTIFERIQALLGQITDALRRAGINNFEDVFQRIESGEIKNRQLPELRDDVQYEIGVGQKGETVTPRELVERADYELQQAEAIGLCLKVA